MVLYFIFYAFRNVKSNLILKRKRQKAKKCKKNCNLIVSSIEPKNLPNCITTAVKNCKVNSKLLYLFYKDFFTLLLFKFFIRYISLDSSKTTISTQQLFAAKQLARPSGNFSNHTYTRGLFDVSNIQISTICLLKFVINFMFFLLEKLVQN